MIYGWNFTFKVNVISIGGKSTIYDASIPVSKDDVMLQWQ